MGDVKQAAERLRRWRNGEEVRAAYSKADSWPAVLRDIDLLVSEHLADNDEAITEEWVTAEYKAQLDHNDTGCRIRWIHNGYFVCVDKLNAFRSLPITFRVHAFPYPESDGESVNWDKMKTRGQLRKLLAALVTT